MFFVVGYLIAAPIYYIFAYTLSPMFRLKDKFRKAEKRYKRAEKLQQQTPWRREKWLYQIIMDDAEEEMNYLEIRMEEQEIKNMMR